LSIHGTISCGIALAAGIIAAIRSAHQFPFIKRPGKSGNRRIRSQTWVNFRDTMTRALFAPRWGFS
jgi:hypothetical protein